MTTRCVQVALKDSLCFPFVVPLSFHIVPLTHLVLPASSISTSKLSSLRCGHRPSCSMLCAICRKATHRLVSPTSSISTFHPTHVLASLAPPQPLPMPLVQRTSVAPCNLCHPTSSASHPRLQIQLVDLEDLWPHSLSHSLYAHRFFPYDSFFLNFPFMSPTH